MTAVKFKEYSLWCVYSSIVSVYFSQIGTSVLFIIYAPPLLCVIFYKQADGFGKLR